MPRSDPPLNGQPPLDNRTGRHLGSHRQQCEDDQANRGPRVRREMMVGPAIRGDLGGVGDTDDRWPVEGRALDVEWRAVHRLVACAARPGGVSAAVAEAGLVTYQHVTGAEGVPVGAAGWWLGYPLPSGISDEVSDDGHTSRVEAARSSSRASTCRLDGSPPLLADRPPDCGE